jgi:hypothetical protein
MVMSICEKRYQQIRAAVQARRLAAKVAKIDWDKLPHFASVDNFLTFLDQVEPTPNHLPRRSAEP